MKDVEIRICKPENAAEFLPRVVRTYENAEFCDEVAGNGEEIFALSAGGETVGLAYIEDDDKAFIYVYIFPEFRGRGYGRAAVLAAEAGLKTDPVKSIETGYIAGDEAAKHLASALGYNKRVFQSAAMRYRGGKFEEPDLPVRKYRSEDFETAWLAAAEAFHKMRLETGKFPDSTVGEISDAAREYWEKTADKRVVVEQNGEITGSAHIEDGEIDVLWIKIPRQGNGYGRKLLKYCVNRILESGHDEVTLWCVVGNDKARRLYESEGFEEVGRAEYAEKRPGEKE